MAFNPNWSGHTVQAMSAAQSRPSAIVQKTMSRIGRAGSQVNNAAAQANAQMASGSDLKSIALGGAALIGAGALGAGITGTLSRYVGKLDIDNPVGGRFNIGGAIPGGAPFTIPDLPNDLGIAKDWWTGTAYGVKDTAGNVWMLKKDGSWKKVPKSKGYMIGKSPTSKNAKRLMAAMKHHATLGGLYADLNDLRIGGKGGKKINSNCRR